MIVSLTGKQRSGKDTVADHLVDNYGFVKMGFADPLRDMLYKLDPIVRQLGGPVSNLQDLVDKFGWEWVKRYTVDGRGLLQRLGTECIRGLDKDFWCWNLEARIEALPYTFDTNIVISDARFPNEASWFSDFDTASEVWRVTRPGNVVMDKHASEAGIPDALVDHELVNDGSVEDLHRAVGALLAPSSTLNGSLT